MSTLGTTGHSLSETYTDAYVTAQGLQGSEADFPDSEPANPAAQRSNGQKHARLVKNGSGGTITKNLLLKRATTNPQYTVGGVAGATDKPCGASNDMLGGAVADTDWFWMITKGDTLITSSAAITKNDRLATATGGKVATASLPPTDYDCGTALAAAAGAAEDILCHINCENN